MEVKLLIKKAVSIIDKEISNIENKQISDELDRRDTENLVDYIRILLALDKEKKEEFKGTPQELEEEIIKAAQKIKERRGQ